MTGLRLAVDKQALSWDAQSPGTTYDVVKGDLGSLAGTGGDFSASLLGCLAPRASSPSASDAATPGPGSGFFYLARAIDCASNAGTFDGAPPGQMGSRDAEIAGSPSRCP